MCALIDELRDLTGPSEFDIATSQLTIRTRTWTGGRRGAPGGYSDSDLVLPQKYKIRQPSSKEIGASGGRYTESTVIARVVPPGDGGTGYTIAQLDPPRSSDGVETIYVISGALAGEYALESINTDRPFRYELVLTQRRTTP